MSVPRSIVQTFAQRPADADVQTFGRGHRPPWREWPEGAESVLRWDAEGRAEFWVDELGRTCGGPNGPITGALPLWSEVIHGEPGPPTASVARRREGER